MLEWTRVLELTGLRVELRRRPGQDLDWFDCRVHVDSHPFAGTMETIFTATDDLIPFAAALESLDAPGEIVLGGGRAAELRLSVGRQVGGQDGTWAVWASVTPSGDDPYPRLEFLIFDADPFASTCSQMVRHLLADSREAPGA